MKGLTPVILIAITIGLFIYYIRPQYDQIAILQAEQQRYDDALSAAGELREIRNNLVNRYNSFSTTDLRRLKKFLPEQIDDVRLVLDVTEIASENNISIESLDIQGSAQTNQGASSGRSNVANESPVNILQMSFTFDATYGQFIDFITDLESSLRVLDITNLSFESGAGTNVYTFSITLQTYWLK